MGVRKQAKLKLDCWMLDEKLCIRSLEESVETWNDYRSFDMSDITILKMDCTNYRLCTKMCTKLARSVLYYTNWI